MKRSKAMFGVAGLTITASALLMSAGVASADTTSVTPSVTCVTTCGPTPVPILALERVISDGKAPAPKVEKPVETLTIVFGKIEQ